MKFSDIIKRNTTQLIIEIALIAIWAIIIGWPYFNFDPQVVPSGREWGSAVASNHIWDTFKSCGTCILWNGFHSGGFPTTADPFTSALHPIVAFTTLLFGVVNGAKLTLVIAMWLAGVAQWWIAYELRLGRAPRVWSAAVAVFGGQLVGRMEVGAFGMLFSVAMTSLLFGALLALARRKTMRSAIVMAIVGASAILAGQSYIQVGFLITGLATVFLFFDEKGTLNKVWKKFILAFLLAILLASPFLIPLFHSYGAIEKSAGDLEFSSAQPIQYLPLNLVISNGDYYRTDILGKTTGPSVSILYIGWPAVILAVIGMIKFKFQNKNILWFFISGIIIGFLLGSAIILKWLVVISHFWASFRFTPLLTIPCVSLILGLSACGLEWLIQTRWPNYRLHLSGTTDKPQFSFHLRWLLAIPLLWSLYDGFTFSRQWISTVINDSDIYTNLSILKTKNAAWVLPPYGEQYWDEPAIGMGLKIADNLNGFVWTRSTLPLPRLMILRDGVTPGPELTLINSLVGMGIYENQNAFYASVSDGNQIEPCEAKSIGGNIDVVCITSISGDLKVLENTWMGWRVWLDNKPAKLVGKSILEIQIPQGRHTISFRYIPFDFYFGLVLSIFTLVFCIFLWFRENNKKLKFPL